MEHAEARWRLGIDIGGTFTDIVCLDGDGRLLTRKVSSSVDNYARAIVEALADLIAEGAFAGEDIAELRHGTTVASNAILEGKGAKTGLIATEGFRDILEIRNLRMPRLYDIAWQKPPPLVPRYLRRTVAERVTHDGRTQAPLDPEEAEAAVRRLLDEGVEAIAVALLHSYANPTHEEVVAGIVERLAPDVETSISHRVLPEAKEYERTSTTVVNALPEAGGLALPGRAGGRLRRYRHTRAAVADAVERRADAVAGGAQPAHAHRRIRSCRRGHRRAGSGQSPPAWTMSSPSTWAARRPRRPSSNAARFRARSSSVSAPA